MALPMNMDPNRMPPEFLAALMAGGAPPPGLPPGMMPPPPMGSGMMPDGTEIMDGPSEDPGGRAMQSLQRGFGLDPAMQSPEPMGMGGMGGGMELQSPLSPGINLSPQPQGPDMGGMGGQDPVLQGLLAQMQQSGPRLPNIEKVRRGKVKKPKVDAIQAVTNRDQLRWQRTVDRFSRDVALFRQHDSARPNSFKRDRETAIKSSEFSTLVNKLAAMFSSVEQINEVPYDNMMEEKSAQIIEDALYYLRKMAKRYYGFSGANLQRDEFFYMFLYGRYVKRILPDLQDSRYPYNETLLDPSTCYPTWGDSKKGLIRMVRKYQATAAQMVSTYGEAIPELEAKIAKKLGYNDYNSAADWMNEEGTVTEYHDSWWTYVEWKGVEVVPITAHAFGRVPYVYVMPVGEPQSMSTPGGHYSMYDADADAYIPHIIGTETDMAEKGVSVFHYLINTHRTKEMLMTLLYNEVEKATDPSTITYTAPHLMGQEPPPLDTKRGGNNTRQMNFQTVEGIPTSPRPTDFSPLFSTIQDEMIQGSLPPGAFGAEQGSNTTASGVTSMVQMALDLVTPYIDAWQNGQAQEAEIKLEMYVDHIAPILTLTVPEHDARGEGTGEVHDLSPMDIEAVGTFVDVKMAGLSMGNEAQQIAAMNQAVQAGFFSQRHAMTKLNVQNPSKMLAEIISEKAMQHPEIMENFIIPEGFISQGMEEFAQMWLELVVAPKMMQMQQQGMGGAPGGGPPGGPPGGGPPGGGGSQAVPQPGGPPPGQDPGGPPPGMGRGDSMIPEGMGM